MISSSPAKGTILKIEDFKNEGQCYDRACEISLSNGSMVVTVTANGWRYAEFLNGRVRWESAEDCLYSDIRHQYTECVQCDELAQKDDTLCFTCRELENNRRYRLHHSIGEYAS